MDILDKIRQWLLTFPQWEEGRLLYIDHTDGVPGNAGLFPAGMEEIRRSEDVLGNVKLRCRYNFALYRVGVAPQLEVDARWLMDFTHWVQSQSAAGLAPKLGEDTRWSAQQGRLRQVKSPGTGLYAIVLSAECTKEVA